MLNKIFKVIAIASFVLMTANAQARISFGSGSITWGSIVPEGTMRGIKNTDKYDQRYVTSVPSMYLSGICVNSQGNGDQNGTAFQADIGVQIVDIDEGLVKNGKATVQTTHELPDPNDPVAVAEFFPDVCKEKPGFYLVTYSIINFDLLMEAQICKAYEEDGLSCAYWKTEDTLLFEGCDGPAMPGQPVLGCNDD